MKERRDEEIAKYEEKRLEKQRVVSKIVQFFYLFELFWFIKIKAAENGEELGEEEDFNVDALLQEEFADELMVIIIL